MGFRRRAKTEREEVRRKEAPHGDPGHVLGDHFYYTLWSDADAGQISCDNKTTLEAAIASGKRRRRKLGGGRGETKRERVDRDAQDQAQTFWSDALIRSWGQRGDVEVGKVKAGCRE